MLVGWGIHNHERCSHKPGGLYSSLFLFIWIVSRSSGTNLHEKSNARGFHVTSSSWLTPVHDRKYRNILFLSWNEKKEGILLVFFLFQLRSTRCVQQQKDPRGGRFPSCFIFLMDFWTLSGLLFSKKKKDGGWYNILSSSFLSLLVEHIFIPPTTSKRF